MKFAAVFLLVVAVAVNAEPFFGAPTGQSATNMLTDLISGGVDAIAGGVDAIAGGAAGAVEGNYRWWSLERSKIWTISQQLHFSELGLARGMVQGGENGLTRGSSSPTTGTVQFIA